MLRVLGLRVLRLQRQDGLRASGPGVPAPLVRIRGKFLQKVLHVGRVDPQADEKLLVSSVWLGSPVTIL